MNGVYDALTGRCSCFVGYGGESCDQCPKALFSRDTSLVCSPVQSSWTTNLTVQRFAPFIVNSTIAHRLVRYGFAFPQTFVEGYGLLDCRCGLNKSVDDHEKPLRSFRNGKGSRFGERASPSLSQAQEAASVIDQVFASASNEIIMYSLAGGAITQLFQDFDDIEQWRAITTIVLVLVVSASFVSGVLFAACALSLVDRRAERILIRSRTYKRL